MNNDLTRNLVGEILGLAAGYDDQIALLAMSEALIVRFSVLEARIKENEALIAELHGKQAADQKVAKDLKESLETVCN